MNSVSERIEPSLYQFLLHGGSDRYHAVFYVQLHQNVVDIVFDHREADMRSAILALFKSCAKGEIDEVKPKVRFTDAKI